MISQWMMTRTRRQLEVKSIVKKPRYSLRKSEAIFFKKPEKKGEKAAKSFEFFIPCRSTSMKSRESNENDSYISNFRVVINFYDM